MNNHYILKMFDLKKFIKTCSMLSSSHDGERSTAAYLASKMLQDAGFTWSDVIKSPQEKTSYSTNSNGTRGWRFEDNWVVLIGQICVDQTKLSRLSKGDQDFIRRIWSERRNFKFTETQLRRLERIFIQSGVV